ncbi:MAG: NAD(P)H-hydrate dehydratase [Burkholderiaceae bacterium]|nr:NAD(P)H-hydrate dehydratase [Burkholderiaceae bacterium]
MLRGLFAVDSVRRIESAWLAQVPRGELMRRAATAVADQATRMLRQMPPETTVLLLVGPGNNGGDALVAGRILCERGYAVRACAVDAILGAPPRAQDAADAWAAWHAAGGSLLPLEDRLSTERRAAPGSVDPRGGRTGRSPALGALSSPGQRPPLVIDGLFGIGLSRSLPSSLVPMLAWIRRLRAPVLAIDMPSGIDADTGAAVAGGPFVSASVTVTMIADKPGLHTGAGLAAAGEVIVAPLSEGGLAAAASGAPAVRGVRPDAVLLDASAIRRLLPVRGVNAHKGTSGDVLVIGGRLGMAGAARLAARGALGAGAGRIAIAGDSRSSDAADPRRPEIMRAMIAATDPIPSRYRVIAVGCGLGQDRQAWQYLGSAVASRALVVCDADALNLLAAMPDLARLVRQRTAPTILTPHPLEAARLLETTTGRIQADRIGAAVALARRFEAVAVLKGAGTVIADPQGNYAINASGNPVLATGGTGDVLAGIIAAIAAGPQASVGSIAVNAACAGVWLHGAAGDLVATRIGPLGVPAGRIADWLPAVFRSLVAGAVATNGGGPPA